MPPLFFIPAPTFNIRRAGSEAAARGWGVDGAAVREGRALRMRVLRLPVDAAPYAAQFAHRSVEDHVLYVPPYAPSSTPVGTSETQEFFKKGGSSMGLR